MKSFPALAISVLVASAASAEETRQLDAHEHGVAQLDIAFDNDKIAMALEAPGADIVGFEYAAETAEDRAKVDLAVATLARPLELFQVPASAGCSVVEASAALESEEIHEDDEHGHEDHKHDDHSDDDHAAHSKHGSEGHTDEDHAAHMAEKSEGHTEFHAEYVLKCADAAAVSTIDFAYFDTFPNAVEVEVQVISAKGANAFEVERDRPILDLRGMF